MGNRKEYYSFHQFAKDVPRLVQVIQAAEKKRGKKFLNIYAPPRGGLALAVCLSHQLDIPLMTVSPFDAFPYHLYDGGPLLDLTEQRIRDFSTYAKGILIVDDIADSGKTLTPFKEAEFFIATLYKHPKSAIEPDIWFHAKQDAWIEFWWEAPDLLVDHATI